MRIAVVEDDDGVGEALVDALAEVGHSLSLIHISEPTRQVR